MIALRYLVDKTYAEDAVEEAYLKIYKSLDTIDPEKDGYNWMCRTVQTTAYELNKKQYRRGEINLEDLTLSEQAAYGRVFDFADTVIEHTDLFNALKTLSEIRQEIVYYRFWEELTFEEIVERLGMAKTTVYDQLRAAKCELGDKLNAMKKSL